MELGFPHKVDVLQQGLSFSGGGGGGWTHDLGCGFRVSGVDLQTCTSRCEGRVETGKCRVPSEHAS